MIAHRLNASDDLVVQLKSLVLVRELLQRRGTAVDAIDTDILRVSEQLTRRAQAHAMT